jgi:peptidoglycan/LPS O-acetylase OafA/YrhL
LKRQLDSIETLRGIAAILVLLHHTTRIFVKDYNTEFLHGFFNPGYLGVDVFFVLSGFIIFYIHKSDIGKPDKLKPFVLKRVIRVYPVYWIIALTLIPIYLAVPSFGEPHYSDPVYLIKSLLLIPQELQPILGVAWSLTHEMFFYLVFALLIFIKPKYTFPVVVSWMLITFVMLFINPFEEFLFINFIFSEYNIEFLLGCSVAYIFSKRKISGSLPLTIGIISFFTFWVLNEYFSFEISRIIMGGLPAALMILGCANLDFTRKPNISPIFKYLGSASYSIYLTHPIFLAASVKIVGPLNLFNLLGIFTIPVIALLAIVAGCIFHSIIEKPILNYCRKRFLPSRKTTHHETKAVI